MIRNQLWSFFAKALSETESKKVVPELHPTPSDISQPNDSISQAWDCSICALTNSVSTSVCNSCGFAKTRPCLICTLINPTSAVFCSACDFAMAWSCSACTNINPIGSPVCNACESPEKAIESTDSIIPYRSSISDSSQDTTSESRERVRDKRWLTDVKDAAFPKGHVAWLKAYERSPDMPIRQTYERGLLQVEVDPNAPIIRIGLFFLEGVDKPSVIHTEMNRETRDWPNQKSPEWRVATAATLLRKFNIRDDLSIFRPDDSFRILEANKKRGPLKKKLPSSPIEQGFSRSSKKPQNGDALSLIKRNIQDHVLTIDSDHIHIIYESQDLTEYDLICTLIEIDMQSMFSLLANFKEIISGGSRNFSSKDTIISLDTMINDVRRLCSRSPTLFRMATRSTIAKSEDTRYGVDFGNVFATMTTSEGIRIFVEKSVSCYLSLDDNSPDQETIRPKFLQMLVMLLALVNDYDLNRIGVLLEDTFQIPGNREGLELLILKVLPLASINSKVFMEDLLVSFNHSVPKDALKDSKRQTEQWQKLQLDLAEKGYILPVLTTPIISHDEFQDDLEALMDAEELEDRNAATSSGYPTSEASTARDGDNVPELPRSWLAPWPPERGIRDSTIFRHIQHCGVLKKEGNLQQETVKAVNNIPHLDVTSEDREHEYLAVFANSSRFLVRSEDPENISSMKKGKYTLKETETNAIVDLDIEAELLNDPFIEATKEHNYLIDKFNEFVGFKKEKRRTIFSKTSAHITFAPLEEPIEATRVWADLVPSSGQRQLCAEAYKLGDRIVFREDLLRNMNDIISRLNANVQRIEKTILTYKVRASDEEISRMQETHLKALIHHIDVIKRLNREADSKRAELVQQGDIPLPTDPISRVIYSSFIDTAGEKAGWQAYVTRLHSDRERLIVQSQKIEVDKVIAGDASRVKLEFHKSKLTLTVRPLNPIAALGEDDDDDDAPATIRKGDVVLWLGYYLVHVEPAPKVKKSYVVQSYFRVLSQKRDRVSRGNQPVEEKRHLCYLV